MLQKAGQGMGRHKEEKAFREFSRHGHVIWDGSTVKQDGTIDTTMYDGKAANYAPTGLDINGNPNGTMSSEDFFDMYLGLMANEYIPTDIIMHPLVWPMFAKNGMLETLPAGAFGGTNNKITVDSNLVQGRLPYELNVTLTPFVPFDRVDKNFDMYVVDRNEVGCLLVKDELSTEQWDNPERDIQNIKVKERYGCALFNDGKAVCVAKNIPFKKTYSYPERVKVLN